MASSGGSTEPQQGAYKENRTAGKDGDAQELAASSSGSPTRPQKGSYKESRTATNLFGAQEPAASSPGSPTEPQKGAHKQKRTVRKDDDEQEPWSFDIPAGPQKGSYKESRTAKNLFGAQEPAASSSGSPTVPQKGAHKQNRAARNFFDAQEPAAKASELLQESQEEQTVGMEQPSLSRGIARRRGRRDLMVSLAVGGKDPVKCIFQDVSSLDDLSQRISKKLHKRITTLALRFFDPDFKEWMQVTDLSDLPDKVKMRTLDTPSESKKDDQAADQPHWLTKRPPVTLKADEETMWRWCLEQEARFAKLRHQMERFAGDYEQRQQESATKIQKVRRGQLQRRKFKEDLEASREGKRREEEERKKAEILERAAIKIQSNWRGRLGRQEAKDKRKHAVQERRLQFMKQRFEDNKEDVERRLPRHDLVNQHPAWPLRQKGRGQLRLDSGWRREVERRAFLIRKVHSREEPQQLQQLNNKIRERKVQLSQQHRILRQYQQEEARLKLVLNLGQSGQRCSNCDDQVVNLNMIMRGLQRLCVAMVRGLRLKGPEEGNEILKELSLILASTSHLDDKFAGLSTMVDGDLAEINMMTLPQ